MDGEDSGGRTRPGRPRWLPPLTRVTTWFAATVAAAVIGVVVTGLVSGWLPGLTGDDPPVVQTSPDGSPRPSIPVSRLVTSERVGRFNVELEGRVERAIEVFGPPSERRRDGLACVIDWAEPGVKIDFYNLGGLDPCRFGRFCWAEVTGHDWSTSRGLEPSDRTRRMFELYPRARYIREAGLVRRYELEPATAPCGNAEAGLEAWTGGGRVFALRVSFQAGGD